MRRGSKARHGLDAHAMGVRPTVYRKLLQRGQQTVAVSLPLHTSLAVLGIAPSALTGQTIALEDLWGSAVTQRLFEQLAQARDPAEVVRLLDSVVSNRLRDKPRGDAHARLALHVADKLRSATVKDIAIELSLSERHLRRVFQESFGVAPKTYAKLKRFGRAVRAASTRAEPSWAAIAAGAGYYDQAHLIAEFRAIAGAPPTAFLRELQVAPAIGWADGP
ncbi:MAG: AraC family transcriptional regulator [Polyangiales bacterium]